MFLYETGTRFIDVDTIPPFWRHGPGENVPLLHTLALRDSVVAMLGRFAQRSEADEEARSKP